MKKKARKQQPKLAKTVEQAASPAMQTIAEVMIEEEVTNEELAAAAMTAAEALDQEDMQKTVGTLKKTVKTYTLKVPRSVKIWWPWQTRPDVSEAPQKPEKEKRYVFNV